MRVFEVISSTWTCPKCQTKNTEWECTKCGYDSGEDTKKEIVNTLTKPRKQK